MGLLTILWPFKKNEPIAEREATLNQVANQLTNGQPVIPVQQTQHYPEASKMVIQNTFKEEK